VQSLWERWRISVLEFKDVPAQINTQMGLSTALHNSSLVSVDFHLNSQFIFPLIGGKYF
jgi:hypothetical protein